MKNIADIPRVESSEPSLDLQSIIRRSGLAESDFDEPWKLKAVVYRSIVTALAKQFAEGEFEITGSEILASAPSSGVKTIYLCIDLFEKTNEAFCEFLDRNQDVIPHELRVEFDVIAGYNFGNKGAILIDAISIRFLPHDEYQGMLSAGTSGEIGYGDTPEAYRKIAGVLRGTVEDDIKQIVVNIDALKAEVRNLFLRYGVKDYQSFRELASTDPNKVSQNDIQTLQQLLIKIKKAG